jgi:hypothetical protein
MAAIEILGKETAVDFVVGDGAATDSLDEAGLLAGAEAMAALIDSRDWPQAYADAFRGMTKIVFFAGKVMVDRYLMDRPCCDQDDAVFYWEAEEFMRNTDADVRANTFFHDCWHVVQFRRAGNRFAQGQVEQVAREVDAIEQQIAVARTLGCDDREIGFLEDFRDDQRRIVARLDEGVGKPSPVPIGSHPTGAMRNA